MVRQQLSVIITPRDPIVARDGRPFGIGQSNHSLSWIYPSVVAGSLRTMLGKYLDLSFTPQDVIDLKAIEIAGPFLADENQLFFPAPRDIVVKEDEQTRNRETFAIRPRELEVDEGCDLPSNFMHPTIVVGADEDFKPANLPYFWSARKMVDWLCEANMVQFNALPDPKKVNLRSEPDFKNTPMKDERVHARINKDTGTTREGDLFSTTGLAICPRDKLVVRVITEGLLRIPTDLSTIHPLGGERRIVHWGITPVAEDQWNCPVEIINATQNESRLRLILASPAIFDDGWKPGWLRDENGILRGTPPGAPPDVVLILRGACVDRWQPISGWSYEQGHVGPKPVRRLVPAGSVYFFEIEAGTIKSLAEQLWLQSISDQEQDRRDGFGLALWGIWEKDTVITDNV